jgi:ABC-type dipeptide/oligopeptide/nickel transport system permease component
MKAFSALRFDEGGMLWRFILRRLVIGTLQLACISVAVFFLMRMLPVDPVARLVGPNATRATYVHTRAMLHLDEPVGDQLLRYLGLSHESSGLLQGNLGNSWSSGESVVNELRRAVPITFELITYSFLVAIVVAVPLGLIAAIRANGRVDRLVFGYGLFAGAQPDFWWGLTFIFVFYFLLHLAPAPLGRLSSMNVPPHMVTNMYTIDALISGNLAIFADAVAHLVLPVFTMAFVLSGAILKTVRQNTIRVLESDFILYARGCGLSRVTLARYILRNSLAPSLTFVGILYGYMLAGAVLIEQVFSLGGLGQYAVRSVLNLDYPAIQAVVLVVTAGSLLTYLIVDLLHAGLDPRVVLHAGAADG